MGFFKGKYNKPEGGGNPLSEFFGFSRSLVRREIIKPYMGHLDNEMLYSKLKPRIVEAVRTYAKNKGKQINEDKLNKFISKHLLGDIYSLYYNQKIELEKKRDNNKIKYKLIEGVNDSLSKIITENSAISSYIFTEEIGSYLGKVFVTELTEQQQDEMNQECDNCNGEGEGEDGEDQKPGTGASKDKAEKTIEHGLDKTRQMFEDALKKAQDKVKDLEKNTDLMDNKNNQENVNHEMTEDVANATHNMPKIKSEVEHLTVNKQQLEKAVEKILDKSVGHFSSRYKTLDVDFLDAEDALDLDGLEYIHPIFQKTMVPELTTTERKYYGKFDLYIDHSGSMGSSCGLNTSHGSVSRTLLAKAIALRMKRMGILNDLYLFDNTVNQIKTTELNILLIGSGGGTHIEGVLSHVRKTGRNSVVLTDGDDNISTYLHNAFFVGVSVGTFHNFRGGDAVKYLERKQCCVFDGMKVTLPSEKDYK